MPLQTTEGVVLKAYNWSESSRTVVFFTRDFGRLALIDKAGRRIISKRGRLHTFSQLELTFYTSRKEGSGYISDVHLIKTFSLEREGGLGRLAYGSAACELLLSLLSDEEGQPELYQYFILFLAHLEAVDKTALPPLFLTFFVHILSYLGYHPALSGCVTCGRQGNRLVNDRGEIPFVPERGGVVCTACQRAGDYYIPLSPESHNLLVNLQTSPLEKAVRLPLSFKESGRLLEALSKFVSYQSELTVTLKSLEFLDKLKNSDSLT